MSLAKRFETWRQGRRLAKVRRIRRNLAMTWPIYYHQFHDEGVLKRIDRHFAGRIDRKAVRNALYLMAQEKGE